MSDLLPPSATAQMRALSLAIARAADVDAPIREVVDPATCPAALLPWLAWAESVDSWDSGWSEARKRAVIAAARAVHQRKGTIGALKLAIEALGYGAEIIEWFQTEPPGDPFTFTATLTVDQEPIASPSVLTDIAAVANGAKNLRSHMTGVNVNGVSAGTFYAGGAAAFCATILIAPEPA